GMVPFPGFLTGGMPRYAARCNRSRAEKEGIMWRVQCVCVLAFVLGFTTAGHSCRAFSVTSRGQFDADARQFYAFVSLEDCEPYREYGLRPGNLTAYVTIPGLDRCTASREYAYGSWVIVRGPFQPRTTYTISVDGAICARTGTGQTTVTFGAYPPAI